MTIDVVKRSYFAVTRDNRTCRIKGEEIIKELQQTDCLLMQRDDVQYKVKLPLNLDRVLDVITEDRDFEYAQYAEIVDPTTDIPLAPGDFNSGAGVGSPDNIFDGNPNTVYKWVTTGQAFKYSELRITFPTKIPVYSEIRVKAGFHNRSRTGELVINGVVVQELDAWDDDPQIFSSQYEGFIETFAIRQKNITPGDNAVTGNTTGAISFIEIDGRILEDEGRSTTITLDPDADMSVYKINSIVLKATDESISGVIGEIDPDNFKITFLDEVLFEVNDFILLDQVDGDPIDFPEIRNDDLFACTDIDKTTYKVTGAQFLELVQPSLPLQITVPQTAKTIGPDTYALDVPATAIDGRPPYSSEWYWESFGRVDSTIPELGGADGENRNRASEPDRPFFAQSDGEKCLVVFSRATQKEPGGFFYYSEDGVDWTYVGKKPSANFKGGKYFGGKFYACGASNTNINIGGLYVVDPAKWDVNDPSTLEVEYKTIGTTNATHVFDVDFNKATGTVIAVGKSAGGRGFVFRTNYLTDPDLTDWQEISISGAGYLRPIVCDPNEGKWWTADEPGNVYCSEDDGLTWTQLPGLTIIKSGNFADVKMLSGYFHVDKDNVYLVQANSVNTCYFKKEAPHTLTRTDDWTYCNTSDKKVLIRTGHDKEYYYKSYFDDPSDENSWILTYDETFDLPTSYKSKPVLLSTPFTGGVWMTICEDKVVVKNILSERVYATEYTKPTDARINEVQLTEVVTDATGSQVQATIPVDIDTAYGVIAEWDWKGDFANPYDHMCTGDSFMEESFC